MTTALPPHVLHSSNTISPLSALSALSTFLTTANDTAAYRPDSILSERGPVSTSTSGTSSLVLHHLNRIKLGLEGIRIGAAEIEAENAVVEAQQEEERASKKRKRDETVTKTERMVRSNDIPIVSATAEEHAEPFVEATVEEGGEWEDKDDYELAQDDEEVDMNVERDPAGGLEQPANAQEAEEMMEVEETQPGTEVTLPMKASEETIEKTVVDKEERKRLKKLKREQEKQKAEGEGNARSRKEKKTVNT